MYILGISAYYHDSAATLILDGKIIAAVQEERLTRVKQDSSFPRQAIDHCLKQAGINIEDVDYFAFYDKPMLKFERLLETYLTEAPKGLSSFVKAIPLWVKEKLFLKETLSQEFSEIFDADGKMSKKKVNQFKKDIENKILFGEHHQSHAASAFFPSPYESAAVLTIDGVGEWTTTSIAQGNGSKMKVKEEILFPHSLGLLYSAFTYYTGFKVNSGEYKVMGLAPYGKPIYADKIREYLIDIKEDGSFRLDMSYFNYTVGLTMTTDKFHTLFGGPPRKAETKLSQKEMDLAASIQVITDEVVIGLARRAKKITGENNLCLSGGVALNCVANGKLQKENIFDNIWIQPAAGDAGGSLGVAFNVYYEHLENERIVDKTKMDAMSGSYLGPSYSEGESLTALKTFGAKYNVIKDEDELIEIVADQLSKGNVVGWHSGKMEFGPRALGARSILGDPRDTRMQSTMNLKIKYRESFRPFAPSVLSEYASDWFDLDTKSPYMLLVQNLKKDKTIPMTKEEEALFGIEQLYIKRSKIPAVTHIDYSARIQTVHKETNPRYHKLISKFNEKTSCPVLINTSFNVRGEPIVCSPEDSYKCFMRTEMDILVIDNIILYKREQPHFADGEKWKETFVLD